MTTTTVALSQRLLTAEQVRHTWFLGEDGKPTVSTKWVLENITRVQLSKRVVRFRADDVELWFAAKVRAA